MRHVGGMCVAKARHHYMNIVTSNLGNPSKKVIENVNIARKKDTILCCLEADIDDLDLELDSSLDETERKMNTWVKVQNLQNPELLKIKS